MDIKDPLVTVLFNERSCTHAQKYWNIDNIFSQIHSILRLGSQLKSYLLSDKEETISAGNLDLFIGSLITKAANALEKYKANLDR